MQDNMDEMKPNYKITPNVQMKEMPKTTLGIHIGPTLISWTLVDCNLNVLVWNYKHWHGIGPRKNSYNIIKLVPCVLESIPAAENYIMEDIKFSKNTIAPYILHAQQQLSLSIMTCLTLRNGTSEMLSSANNVYVLHPQTTVRYFNALHNFQNIDTNYLVNVTPTSSVIRISDTKSIDIYLNSDIKNKYLSANIDDQEQMRWPLLKVLAYLRIFAIKNHNYNWYF
ncbi:uncharacterized protein LOC128875860 [Hylaeus volcanicus]|uniref:uncharacterized protein LOC128875860 n=1 Tax=Hylaeus volcanicus TaxID=313075 RepID=UPI0023B7CBF2|nr:uncharacterized protein LOC128875860 [Hylaeus volcanicus]